MQLLVLGMHRSGTSVLTRVLGALGCHLGDRFVPSTTGGDPGGYRERPDVLALNDRVLAECGGRWYLPVPVDPARVDLARFEQDAREALAELEPRRPWALKDPRLCLTLPLWRRVLARPICVLIHRHPLQVARSLQTRDGIPVPVGIGLWQRYVLEALRHSADLPRILVSYRALALDPREEIERLQAALKRTGVPLPERGGERAWRGVVEPDRYHHREEGDAWLDDAQRALVAALENGRALEADPPPEPAPPVLELVRGYGELRAARDRIAAERRRLDAGLEYWSAQYEEQVGSLLRSRRWRWGNRIGGILDRLRGRRPVESAENRARRIRRGFEEWRRDPTRPPR